jgi:hypothetical protein
MWWRLGVVVAVIAAILDRKEKSRRLIFVEMV